jgi:hypothetical protein
MTNPQQVVRVSTRYDDGKHGQLFVASQVVRVSTRYDDGKHGQLGGVGR